MHYSYTCTVASTHAVKLGTHAQYIGTVELAYTDSAHALRYPPRSQRGSMDCTAARAPLQANMADQVMRTGSHACMSVHNQCSMHGWRAACMHGC